MEIVFRAAFVFFFLWLVTRVIGKRSLSQMTAFELVLLFVIGDLIQQGVTQEDYSLSGAVLAVGTFAVLTLAVSYVSWRWQASRSVIEGTPVVIVRDGEVQWDDMRYERMPLSELKEAAREQGIERITDIELAILEPDGKVSFFTRTSDEPDVPTGPRDDVVQ